ncbi:26S proteasome regulatory subunit 4 [Halotydeus destructor]|nr:26S proteasome regulatory subunit 4 [Halotydeus destructor]
MGQNQSGPGGGQGGDQNSKDRKKEKRERPAPPPPSLRGKRGGKRGKGPDAASKLPLVTPHARCRLKLLKLERIHDWLLMEEEFLKNSNAAIAARDADKDEDNEERNKVDDLRGTPMSVGNLEEIIDDNHAIVSTSVGSEHYVSILSFVDKDQLEPNCSVLLNHKVHAVVGVLGDDVDPMVNVMKLEKAPQETYADIGGLDQQIQEIKESVELPLTHPEYYEEMGIKPPKGVILKISKSKMDDLSEKIDMFSKELKGDLALVLHQKQMTINKLLMDNDKLRDVNRKLLEENKGLCDQLTAKRHSNASGDITPQASSASSSSLHSQLKGFYTARKTITNANSSSSSEPKINHSSITSSNSQLETFSSCSSHMSNHVTHVTIQEHQLCIHCKLEPAETEGQLCICCYTWQHSYCVKNDALTNFKNGCVYCHFLEERFDKDEIAMSGRPPGCKKHPADWSYYYNFVMKSGKVIKVGDCVYLEREGEADKNLKKNWDIIRISHLYKNGLGDKMLFGYHYYRGQHTYYKPSKRFYQNEVFEVSNYTNSAPLSAIRGFCAIIRVADYAIGRPRFVNMEDTYITEQSYKFTLRKKPENYGQAKMDKELFLKNVQNAKFGLLKNASSFVTCKEICSFVPWQQGDNHVAPERCYIPDGDEMIRDTTYTPRKKLKQN